MDELCRAIIQASAVVTAKKKRDKDRLIVIQTAQATGDCPWPHGKATLRKRNALMPERGDIIVGSASPGVVKLVELLSRVNNPTHFLASSRHVCSSYFFFSKRLSRTDLLLSIVEDQRFVCCFFSLSDPSFSISGSNSERYWSTTLSHLHISITSCISEGHVQFTAWFLMG